MAHRKLVQVHQNEILTLLKERLWYASFFDSHNPARNVVLFKPTVVGIQKLLKGSATPDHGEGGVSDALSTHAHAHNRDVLTNFNLYNIHFVIIDIHAKKLL